MKVEIELPKGIHIDYEHEPDGRWLAVVEKYPGVMAYGTTKDQATGHVIELLLNVLAERP